MRNSDVKSLQPSPSGDATPPEDATEVGASMAFQVVSQATSATVVDASQFLRGQSALTQAALASLTARMVQDLNAASSGDPSSPSGAPPDLMTWQQAVDTVQKQMEQASCIFKTIGVYSAQVLRQFKDLEGEAPDPGPDLSCFDHPSY